VRAPLQVLERAPVLGLGPVLVLLLVLVLVLVLAEQSSEAGRRHSRQLRLPG